MSEIIDSEEEEKKEIETRIVKAEYPSNSFKSRKEALIPEKNVTKVTKGGVIKKKKSLSDSFAQMIYSEDTRSIGAYIVYDVLIPAFKDTISQMITTGIEMLLYGESNKNRNTFRRGGRDRDPSRTHVSYNSFSNRERDRGQRDSRNKFRQRFDDVILDTRADAEEVLSNMVDLIDNYGVVTVADFYDLIGLPGEWSDNKYGWENLSQAYVERVRLGYTLALPKTTVLD
jgi:hypothetical protein